MAEITGFSQLLEFMAGADAFSLLLPFLLSWIVFYIALERADFIFDKDSLQNIPPVLALLLAFFTARFIVMNPFYQTFFIDFFGKITIGIVGVLGLFALLAFSGYEDKIIQTPALVILLLMMAGAAFLAAGGFGSVFIESSPYASALRSGFSWMLESGAVWLVFIGLVIWYVTRDPGSSEGGSDTSILSALLSAEKFHDMVEDDGEDE